VDGLDAGARAAYRRPMGRLAHELGKEEDLEGQAAPPQPMPVAPGTLAWASAVGNQAVQGLARRSLAREAVEEDVEEEPAEDAPVADVAPEADPGIAPEEAAGLAALDDLPEDDLTA
jgi:hypothetical protein